RRIATLFAGLAGGRWPSRRGDPRRTRRAPAWPIEVWSRAPGQRLLRPADGDVEHALPRTPLAPVRSRRRGVGQYRSDRAVVPHGAVVPRRGSDWQPAAALPRPAPDDA